MYAIIHRYRDSGRFVIGRVYLGFLTQKEAGDWNEQTFPSPDYNLIRKCSEVK